MSVWVWIPSCFLPEAFATSDQTTKPPLAPAVSAQTTRTLTPQLIKLISWHLDYPKQHFISTALNTRDECLRWNMNNFKKKPRLLKLWLLIWITLTSCSMFSLLMRTNIKPQDVAGWAHALHLRSVQMQRARSNLTAVNIAALSLLPRAAATCDRLEFPVALQADCSNCITAPLVQVLASS